MDSVSLRQQFDSVFGSGAGDVTEVRAPGRVNLIGEHTDYNDGYVCPMAIDRTTAILCRKRNDAVIRVHSVTANETTEFSVDAVVPKSGPAWSLYPRGVAEALRLRKLVSRGMDALVVSDVPIGGGLSSSASFEVATALALLTLNGTKMEKVEMALACQWAEHHYPGMPCGIMDQFISALGRRGHALLLDCRDRSTRQVPLSDPDLRIVIVNTNVKHELVQGEYTARRHQCESAVAYLARKNPGMKSLRDATEDMLDDSRLGMDPTVFKRAHHVITEIARTIEFADALEIRNYAKCGKLMYASHTSLRDDYAVSCKELDVLVEIARSVGEAGGVYGARMTGGGFGGCIVALAKASAVAELTKRIEAEYPKKTGKKATVFATVPSEGAHVVKA